jgi:polysaccharide export outer membrane protein
MNYPRFLLLTVLALSGPAAPRAGSDNHFLDEPWQPAQRAAPRARDNAQAAPANQRAAPAVPARGGRSSPAADAGQLVPAIVGLPPAPGAQQAYRIGSGDLIRIQVFQVDELSSEERVNEHGQIVMPLVGPVAVGGLTAQDAEGRIAAILGKDYLQNPQVDVYVKEAVSQQITVMGSVNKPGVFPISGQTTLLQAVALAQGFNPLAKESEVILFRKDEGGRPVAYIVDLVAVQRGELTDPPLVGDDRVVVPESGTAAFVKGVTDTLRGFVRLPYY